MNPIKIADLEMEAAQCISISPSYLAKIISGGMYGEKHLEGMLLSMAHMTSQTGREVSAVVYSKMSRRDESKKTKRSLNFLDFRIVPSLGNFHSVPDPAFYNSALYQDFIHDGKGKDISSPSLVLPLVHVHTHPSTNSFPSKEDLLNAGVKYQEEIDFGTFGKVRTANPTLNIIIGTSGYPGNPSPNAHEFTFYQLNGYMSLLDSFVRDYDDHHAKSRKDTTLKSSFGDKTPLTKDFMEKLKAAGVCKYLHFPASDSRDGDSRSLFVKDEFRGATIPQKNLAKIGSHFAYEIKFRREPLYSQYYSAPRVEMRM
ncbi:MAG TPA: hypothetical protein VJH92_03915 [Candidatus Nanoarchaeia archaeon]|nr:hypothetical protein [Candidatus Nanoarchaeia archaeon]